MAYRRSLDPRHKEVKEGKRVVTEGGCGRRRRTTRRRMHRAIAADRREGGTEEKKRGRCDRSVRVQVMQRTSGDTSFSLSFSPLLSSLSSFLPSSRSHIRHYIRLSLSLSLSLSFCRFLFLSLSCCGDSVLQVVRPPIGGCTRRCAWVGEAWYPPPIGYRILPTPEVGTWRRKEDRNERGEGGCRS